MMPSILTSEPAAETIPVEPSDEFELVFGKRQIAGVLFLATIVLAVFSALSYLAGKTAAPTKTVIVEKTVQPSPTADPVPPKPESPMFAEPVSSSLYIQMGAVEKGIAVIFAEGLRTHGFQAFVAAGPNEKIFRVLIGPLADQDAYRQAKDSLDTIGLTTFARRYEP